VNLWSSSGHDFCGFLIEEELLCNTQSWSGNFVLAPPCLLPAPAVAQAQVSQKAKGVTRVQVLGRGGFSHFNEKFIF